MQSLETIDDLFQKISSSIFSQSFTLLYFLLKVSFLTELHYNQDRLVRHKVIDKSHYIRVMLTSLHALDFSLDQLLYFRVLKVLH